MTEAEYIAECLTNFRNEVELPRAEHRERVLRELALTEHDRARPRAGVQFWLRPALRHLGEQLIAAGRWLAQGDGDLSSPEV